MPAQMPIGGRERSRLWRRAFLTVCDVVVDAVFGAGLSRPVEGEARATLESVEARRLATVAVDVPSGLNGDTGAVLGYAVGADVTVTFYRRKPGHLLYPGRGLCGRVRVADIGTPESVLDDIAPRRFENAPSVWLERFPRPGPLGHKYSRGHALIAGGRELTGAARLAAYAALRAGAGLVSIAAHPDALGVYRAGRPSIMVREAADTGAFADTLKDDRIRAVVVGPGNGVDAGTRGKTLAALSSNAACVIDADAITAFADDTESLFAAIRKHCADTVLTPHEGEFARLFKGHADVDELGRLAAAQEAARISGAVVVLKGPDSIVASPDGRTAINTNAPPELATAGSGDVLAGFISGLLAQGLDGFDAAAAAVWLHGAAATEFDPGLIAEDIADSLPPVLRRMREVAESAGG